MKYFISIFSVLVFIPTFVQAKVIISEIAWMGTIDSAYSEWLELYNDGDQAVNLNNWKIYKSDGVLLFTLTKTIDPDSFLIIERTTKSAPDALSGIEDESGTFGGGGLSNSGENLYLKDDKDQTIDSVLASSGWSAGDIKTKDTMQWNGSLWITASPTPKSINKTQEIATFVPTENTEESSITNSAVSSTKDASKKIVSNKPYIDFNFPTTVYQDTLYWFEAQPVLENNYKVAKGSFYWNLGDGTTFHQQNLAPISHTYLYPGNYTIAFVYTDPENQYLPLTAEKTVMVLAPEIKIRIVDQKGLEISNQKNNQLDLTGWSVLSGTKRIIIPDRTILAPKATAVIPFLVLGIQKMSNISLLDPTGRIISTLNQIVPILSRVESVSVSRPVSNPISLSSSESSSESSVENPGIFFNKEATEADSPLSSQNTSSKRTYLVVVIALGALGLFIVLERLMAR